MRFAIDGSGFTTKPNAEISERLASPRLLPLHLVCGFGGELIPVACSFDPEGLTPLILSFVSQASARFGL
jgi:hypothetical protein